MLRYKFANEEKLKEIHFELVFVSKDKRSKRYAKNSGFQEYVINVFDNTCEVYFKNNNGTEFITVDSYGIEGMYFTLQKLKELQIIKE